MPVPPRAARHRVEDTGDKLSIFIPSLKQWFQILTLGLWLIAFACGGLTGISSDFAVLFSRGLGGVKLSTFAWLGLWALVMGVGLFTLLWQITGEETIEITSQSIALKRTILGIMFFSKEYAAEYIQDLGVSIVSSDTDIFGWSKRENLWGIGRGLLAFDYGAETVRFGSEVEEAEAKQILALIQGHLSQYHSGPRADR